MSKYITINSDASHHPKYKVAGWAYIVTISSDHRLREYDATRNVENSTHAEMQAVLRGIQAAKPYCTKQTTLVINCDNNGVMMHINGTEKVKGMGRYDKYLDAIRKRVKELYAKEIKGHSKGNEARTQANIWCDQQAKHAMRSLATTVHYERKNSTQPKLTIELVPSSSFYKNVRSEVTSRQWNSLRKTCYKKAGHVCEICGDTGLNQGRTHAVECHEIWSYENGIQKLEGLIALCPNCHAAKHAGLARIQGREHVVIQQLMKVNSISEQQALMQVEQAFELWHKRSQRNWLLDISLIDKLLGHGSMTDQQINKHFRQHKKSMLNELKNDMQ